MIKAGSTLEATGKAQASAMEESLTGIASGGSEEILIENELSRYGLRTMHVMRMGAAVERGRWVDLVPVVCRDFLSVYAPVEAGLGVHHLYLWWPTRDVARFKYADGSTRDGVFWWIGKSFYDPSKTASIREAADFAAMTFEMAYHRDATQCLVGKILDGWKMKSGEGFEVEGEGRPIRLELVEEGWVPRGFVVVF